MLCAFRMLAIIPLHIFLYLVVLIKFWRFTLFYHSTIQSPKYIKYVNRSFHLWFLPSIFHEIVKFSKPSFLTKWVRKCLLKLVLVIKWNGLNPMLYRVIYAWHFVYLLCLIKEMRAILKKGLNLLLTSSKAALWSGI